MSLIKITGKVAGVEETTRRFAQSRSVVWERLKRAMETSGGELEGGMKSAAQSELKPQSGRLFRSIFHKLYEKDNVLTLKAGVKPRAFYGAFFQQGVDKVVDVKGFVRRTHSVRGVTGVSLKTSKDGTVSVAPKKGKLAEGVTFVKPYSGKRVRVPKRPFITGTYQALKSDVEEAIMTAVRAGVK